MAGFEFFALYLIDELEKGRQLHNRRRFTEGPDPLSLSDETFVKQFRISKQIFSFLVEVLTPALTTIGYCRVKPNLKILTALRFYATGKFQKSLADDAFLSVSQSSVSRCIHSVSQAITEILSPTFIKFPNIDEEEKIKKEFLDKYRFPNVLGVIDSTYLPLKPTDLSTDFFNYKGICSLKIQMVTDSSLQILGIKSDSPGGVEDRSIWYKNEIRNRLSLYQDNTSWLLGDNNYPLEPWLLTPFEDPDESQTVFNEKHFAARECMRKCKKLLKQRFKCLDGQRRLFYAPPQVSNIINACAVLHNLCILHNVPFETTGSVDEDSDDEDDETGDHDDDDADQFDDNVNSIINDVASLTRHRTMLDLL